MNKLNIASSAALASVIATITWHLIAIRQSTCNVSSFEIDNSTQSPNAFLDSTSAKTINPSNHPQIYDTRSINIQTCKGLSNEQILARFTKGFFGGHVFKIERGILRAMHKEIVCFNKLKEKQVSSQVWSAAQISNQRPPALHTVLFGAFRVIDYHFMTGHGYIDFAFGSDNGFIAGVHRFIVERNGSSNSLDGENQSVTIEFAHLACNPKENKPLGPDVVQTLHLWYAELLFREGVAEVLKSSGD